MKRDEVRARLLKVAYGVFAERGYEGASLERVAEAAGFSKGAVYSNFANKDELFFELVAARIDERTEAVRSTAERLTTNRRASKLDAPPRANMAASLARLAGEELGELGEADPAWQMLFIEFWLRCVRNEGLRTQLAEKRREMRSKIANRIENEARESGIQLTDREAMDMATTVLALSNGLGIEGLIDPDAVRPALFGEMLARIAGTEGPRR
jgi:AcrR family transcriptional regulator